jgi:hypothetical protein
MPSKNPSASLVALLWWLAMGQLAAQTVPPLVNYQGRLSNPDGSPLPTADYTLTFNLYDAATNGALVWGPQVFDGAAAQGHGARIPVVQGYFNVMLGPVDTNGVSLADVFNAPNRFVEITVSNRPPIAPRQQILATPFAFQAGNAAKLAGYDWSAVFGTNDPAGGKIPGTKLAEGTVTLTNLAARQIGTNVGVGGMALSTDSGLQTFSGTGIYDVPNLTVSITTSGRPVWVGLIGGTNFTNLVAQVTVSSSPGAYIRFLDGTNLIHRAPCASAHATPSTAFQFLHFPPAGTRSYNVQIEYLASGSSTTVEATRLVAFEL